MNNHMLLPEKPVQEISMSTLNEIAEHYVRLTLAVGEHDPGYIDAYTGPAEWQQQVDRKSTRLNSSHSQQSRMPSSA